MEDEDHDVGLVRSSNLKVRLVWDPRRSGRLTESVTADHLQLHLHLQLQRGRQHS
jgi:hypothetical protein